MSEEEGTSDKGSVKLLRDVRRGEDFGQRKREIACGCPKRRGLRTREARNCLGMSEEERTSDKGSVKRLVDVRRGEDFGQGRREIA